MNVALYSRVSSDKQDVDLSVSAQLKALRTYAVKNRHRVVKEFVDEAESGRTTARPAFREMIAMARRPSKPFDAILVWKYSRFARSREDSIVFKTMLRKIGVQVVSITEPFEDTPTGRLLEAMIESLDEFYSANLSEEVTRGLRESASRGFYVAGFAPYGYRKVKVKDGIKERPKLEPVGHEAEIVSRIYEHALEGKGLKQIGKELKLSGVAAPRSGSWGKTTIYKILTNEAYVGVLVWGRVSSHGLPPVRVENAWPAIVDRDTLERVRMILKNRSPANSHPRRTASRYLLSGLAKCGYCGKALVGQEAKGGRFSYYVCGTLQKKGAGTCQARYLNSQRFEGAVIDEVKRHILTSENLVELVRLVNEELDLTASETLPRLDSVTAEIGEAERRLERLYDALETGRVSVEDLAPRIQENRQRLDILHTTKRQLENSFSDRRVELADLATVTHYVADLRGLLDQSPLEERRSFIRSFVKEVRVTGNEVLLTYAIPMPPRQPLQENLRVQPTVHVGGPLWIRTTDPGLIRTVL